MDVIDILRRSLDLDRERIGVRKIFTPGASMQAIVEWVRANVGQTV